MAEETPENIAEEVEAASNEEAAAPEAAAPAATRRERNAAARQAKAKQATGPRTLEERLEERRAHRQRNAAQRRAYRAKQKAKRAEARASAPAPQERHAPEHGPGRPKVRQGVVTSDKGEKTITVRVDITRRHKRYHKILRSSITLHAHDERNDAHAGDTVRIQECRPMSRTKRWRLLEVLERAR
jgi:small subunit ribosomal protein S17